MGFFAIIMGVKDFISRHKTFALYLLGILLTCLVALYCIHAYHAKLKAQYDAGYATAVTTTDAKWERQLDKQRLDNNKIVDSLRAENSARADLWSKDVKDRDQKIKDLLEKQATILARDNKGHLLVDQFGKPEQCYMGKDFADAWNNINKIYGLDKP